MQQLRRLALIFPLCCLVPPAGAAELMRCTSKDGQTSYLTRSPCKSADEKQAPVSAVKPLVPRDNDNTRLIRCTSRDGKKVSIQRGNCAAPDDYQQLLR